MLKVKDLIIAAGGVVLRESPGGGARESEVLLVHRPRYGDWSFPKGKLDSGESPLEAAVREVREETGFDVTVRGFAGAVGYLVNGVPKTVLFWVMRPGKQGPIEDREEVSELVWLRTGEAMHRLSYGLEKEILAKVAGFTGGPPS